MEKLYKAHAKVNVGLKVGKKDLKGYHPLSSYFHLISLCDDIYTAIEPGAQTKVKISGNEEYLDENCTDLMEKAALLFSRESGINFSLNIRIVKRIPYRAGLGGGSSDCATILRALEDEYNTGMDLALLSSRLGADVPFFISGFFAAKAEGYGEKLVEIEGVESSAYLFCPKDISVDTKTAFLQLDREVRPEPELPFWTPDCKRWYELYPNDFLSCQEDSECKMMKDEYKLMLTGSGSCYFSVYAAGFSSDVLEKKFVNTDIIPFDFIASAN